MVWRVSIDPATNRLVESQSGYGDLIALYTNAQRLGYMPDKVIVKTISDDDYQVILQSISPPPAIGVSASSVIKNYIINGAMMVSQENGAAASTVSGYYPVDMFMTAISLTGGTVSFSQVASTTPSGSPNRLRCTVTTPQTSISAGNYTAFVTAIEGLRSADLTFGTSTPLPVIIQFGCRGPAGTYSVSLTNGPQNRSYPIDFTIDSNEANIDVVKSVIIPGDTIGAWATDTSLGMRIWWTLTSGSNFRGTPATWQSTNLIATTTLGNFLATNGNVFELFDVSMSIYTGGAAPAFQVPFYVDELPRCQRFYEQGAEPYLWLGGGFTATAGYGSVQFIVPKRITPTVSGTNWQYFSGASGVAITPTFNAQITQIYWTVTGLTNWNGWTATGTWKANARLM